MNKLYPLLALALMTNAAYAQDQIFSTPEPKLGDAQASTWNIGAGFTKKMIHVNPEWVNPYGIGYVKAGKHPLLFADLYELNTRTGYDAGALFDILKEL